ncbi:DDT domain-containing protein DDR4-like [Lolium rigidum]|uniref:DDT domain-containing protein DDR4-like n=1 Tax=Lolium rigidum TaxID=89674 RepID=UPI001F5CFE67|nr:DDT domain-containing protein DDR4-like [Lolium rigidum]
MASPAKRARPSSPPKPPGPPPPPPEDAPAEDPRLLLRRRWELASVLHFLQVFEPVIEAALGLSADEIETALIANNRDLARVHIALLKGIPPVAKNLNVDDGWIMATAKKLSDWWSWVAEGTNPFKQNPGKEVETFKELDPVSRLFILKALCEVRSEQNDAVWYINDEMKKGVNISNFRKEKLGSASDGSVYWYVGDSTVGHRLFKEDVTVDYKQNWKGKNGRLTKPVLNIHWETAATNLDEFLDISEKLCSKGRSESAIGQHLKENTIPAVEKFQKKKERELKRRQQKDERALVNIFQTRALRERKPVSYNYSDYDRSIKEAIKATAKGKESDPPKEAGKKRRHVPDQGDNGANVGSDISPENNEVREQEDAKDLDDPSSDDGEVSDYNDKDDGSSSSDDDTDASDSHESNSDEEEVVVTRKRTRLAARKVDSKPRQQGLRRSRRNMKSDDEEMVQPGQVTPEAMTKKTTRQRPTPISKQFAMSGSEDEDDVVADSGSESEDDVVADSGSGSEEDDVVADSGSVSGSEDDGVAESGSGSEDDAVAEPDADSGEESGSP